MHAKEKIISNIQFCARDDGAPLAQPLWMEPDAALMEEDIFVSNEEDPVVSEMPVYVSCAAGANLVVAQFPTRKAPSASTIARLRLKEKSGVLETDVESAVPASYVDETRQTARHALTQTFSGVVGHEETLAVAYQHGDALYLSLVPRAVQLRPKFAPKPSEQEQAPGEKQEKPAPQLRSVQMSVKSATNDAPRCSSVLDFWRKAGKEENLEYATEYVDSDARHALLAQRHEQQVPIEATEMTFL